MQVGDVALSMSFPMLSKTNYSQWDSQMEVLLEAHRLWEVFEVESVTRKKDRQALSILLRAIIEEIQAQLNIKRPAK